MASLLPVPPGPSFSGGDVKPLPCHPDLVASALGDPSIGPGGPRLEGKKEACLSMHPAGVGVGGIILN